MPAPDRVYRTEAVVLRRHDLGETDRILTLYTPHYGKIRVVAKGVRKPSSRKAGYVELFMRTEMMMARSQGALDIVTQVEMKDAFLPLRENLVRATYASHLVELLDAFTEEADENQDLYRLLVNGLGWLCRTDDLQCAARYYELHLLDLVGYRPQLFECVICGETICPQPQFYSPVDGGVLCPSCGRQYPRAKPISLNALKLLRYMQTHPFEAVEKIKLSPAVRAETESLLHATLVYHLERQLKSVAFLQRLRRENWSG
jgi:DNA repair protein RecO (recombination protein O)